MIHLLYGKDEFERHRALARLRAQYGGDDSVAASNVALLDGRALTPQELLAHTSAAPFLAEHRLVIVDGLIGAVGGGRGRRKKAADDPLDPWRQAAARLADPAVTPDTTVLVLVEGDVGERAAFGVFARIAEVTRFDPPRGRDLEEWIRREGVARGARLEGRAAWVLANTVGPDLWALSGELDKLATWSGGDPVDEKVARSLVAAAKETKVWELTDAVADGDEPKALAALARMLREGEPPALLASMVVRAYRHLVLAKDMSERMASRDAIARATGAPPFRVDSLIRLARSYARDALRAAYGRLLEADLNVKRGLQDDESALQLLVHDLCALAPRAASARR